MGRLIHRNPLLGQGGNEHLAGRHLVVGADAAGGEHRRGHIILGDDHQPGVVEDGVAPLGHGLNAAVGKGVPVDAVPAQAVGDHILGVLRPNAPGVLVGHGGGNGVRAENPVLTEHRSAEGGQIGGGGVDAAGAVDAHGLGGEGAGLVRPVVGLGQQALVEVLAGEPGVLQPGGLQNGLAHVVVKVHTADRLHHRLGQGEAVVAVDAERAGIGLEGLAGQLLQQGVGRQGVRVVEQEAVGDGGAGQARRVVEEHAHGDIRIAPVGHGEVRQVGGHRGVQLHLPLVYQLEDGGGGVGLAHRANAVQNVIGEGAVLRAGIISRVAGEDDLPILPQGVLDALGPAGRQGGLGGGLGGLLQRRCGLRRAGGQRDQGEGQGPGGEQGTDSFHVQFLLFAWFQENHTPSTKWKVKHLL